MERQSTDEPPRPGLRERKKAKTRALIQAEAMRLFREQGYDETSIEQIAEAAEVSPSTVFRYFATKPELVIYDDLDDRMIEAFHALPPDMSATQAMRTMFHSTFAQLPADELEMQLERAVLIQSVPELRAAMLDEMIRTLREITQLIAERTGRSPDDDEVVTLAGAVIGIAMAAWYEGEGREWLGRFIERVDAGLELLERGVRL